MAHKVTNISHDPCVQWQALQGLRNDHHWHFCSDAPITLYVSMWDAGCRWS